jgi:hypothetical protein
VPHTHWDREWYAPFQTFRVRLVGLVDELLDLLERDESYERFLLDGQTVVVDDYLAIRPDAAERIAKLAAAGRLQVGPWMVLMDEFMVSGETMVRDLQLGIARATELGAVMEVGYLPDMFGHVAQMPQLLRLVGFDHAVVWRGVPAAVERTAFHWVAPDGSGVRAEYLYGSYSNGRDLPPDAAGLVRRAHGYQAELGPATLAGGGLLLMNGTDHQLPQPWLGDVVAAANAEQSTYHFAITSLPEYLAEQPTPDDLPTWTGELRSGARANVLMGVASNRVDVHRACAGAERSLERRAEPLSALLLPRDRYPYRLLAEGWRNLVLNSAHDSSCACSADEVVDAVLVRYQEARQIGDALTRDALRSVAPRIDAAPGSTIVCNPTRVTRGGLVRVVVPGDGPVQLVSHDGVPCPTQVVRTLGGDGFTAIVAGRKVRWVLELIRGPEFAGARIARVTRRAVAADDWEYTFHAARAGEPLVDLEHLRDELLSLGDGGATLRFRQTLPPAREVLFHAGAVPGFGWRTFVASDGAGPPSGLSAEGRTLENEHLTVEVDGDDGTFTLTTTDGLSVAGCNRLVDGGDGGDTYNYSPPLRDEIVDAPDFVRVDVLERGPVRASLLVTALYELPRQAIGDERRCTRRSDETARVEVATTLELRAGERFVRVRVELDNACRDHRLRAHFPLPARAEGSDAECAFAVVHRDLTAEGGPNEAGLPTFVSRRFVDCSDGSVGLALLHDGLLEYEVITGPDGSGTELALTLLRCVGYLSRSELSLRPNPAGPLDPLEGPQLHGRHVVDYAVLPHRGDWRAARLHDAADELLVPLERVRAAGTSDATMPATGSVLGVDGAEVSAVMREDGALKVRVYNASPNATVARIRHEGGPARGDVVDLRGRELRAFDGMLALRPWEIATLRIVERSGARDRHVSSA